MQWVLVSTRNINRNLVYLQENYWSWVLFVHLLTGTHIYRQIDSLAPLFLLFLPLLCLYFYHSLQYLIPNLQKLWR